MPNMGVDDEFEYNHLDEVPLSPIDQVFRELYSPKSENVISCALGLRDPIDVESLKKAVSNSIMIKHPRFSSLVVKDQKSGLQHWKRTRVNIDNHIFVHQQTIMKIDVKLEDEDEKEAAINAFLAKISVATPLSENKPLWEVHVLLGLNCVVLRVHHSLGDGVSLMSMLSACFGKPRPPVLDIQGSQDKKKNDNNTKKKWRRDGIWEQVKSVWYTIAFLFKVIGRLLWVKEISVLSGGDGVELWPRNLVTAKFHIHELKSIKSVIPKATINDVLLGIISSGLSKYLNIKSSHAVQLQQAIHQLNFVIPINMRKDSFIQILNSELSGWGNKTSVVILPTNCCNGLEPLEHVRENKSAMDKLKLSYWPQFILQFIRFISSCFGPKVASWFFRKVVCYTTSTISNIVGPSEELLIADNPVTYIKVNISSIPHAITMLIVSYAGMVNLQVMVAKDIIPDPELIVKCFQDSFQEMRRSLKTNLQD